MATGESSKNTGFASEKLVRVASPTPLPGTEERKNGGFEGQKLTIEGFRSLSVVAIFFAGLQAQILAITILTNDTKSAQAVNAMWLAGLVIDVFGAVQAALAARWFEVLSPRDSEALKKHWSIDKSSLRKEWKPSGIINWAIATALFAPFGTVALGVLVFFVGLLTFVWSRLPTAVAVVTTIPFPFLGTLIAASLYPHRERKEDIIVLLALKRGSW